MRMRILALCLLAAAGVHATAQAADQTLRLAVGQQAAVSLKENPSTGYKWQIDRAGSSNLAILRVSDLGFSRGGAGGKRIGAPGLHRWSVSARAPGHAVVVFSYRRPWEHGAPARRHTVAVEIVAR
jgi:inhibitor of cysteine peptidase